MRLIRLFSSVPPVALFILNVLAWGITFYRKIVLEHKTAFGTWLAEIAVPGMLALCYLGYYGIRKAESQSDITASYLVSYVFLGIGVAGRFGY